MARDSVGRRHLTTETMRGGAFGTDGATRVSRVRRTLSRRSRTRPTHRHGEAESKVAFREGDERPFAVRGEGEAGADVLGFKVREVREDLGFRHAGREVVENVIDRDPQAANARLAAALGGVDGDPA